MRKKSEHFHFEESVIDAFGEGFNKIEQPLTHGTFIFTAAAIFLIFLITIVRILTLNIGWGNFYQSRALININKETILPTQRGMILDRFNKPLLKNVPSFNASLNLGIFFKKENEASNFNDKIDRTVKKLNEVLGLDADELRQEIEGVNLEKNDRLILARNINLEQAINLKTLNLNGVEVSNDYKRDYIDSHIFSYVLGYTGASQKNNDVIGVSGLEAYYDDYLRGQPGRYLILRDVKGNDIDKKVLTEAQPGRQLVTTIDSEFQKYFYNRLQLGLEQLGRKSGLGLAINPQTGEILALINIPSFDNNNPAKYLTSGSHSLFNRTISGLYNPGSTIKPLVALAALKENIMTPDWETYSKGYLELPNPYNPDKPSRFLDWRAHGWVNLRSALARSSNIYFYIVGGGCPINLDCQSRPKNITGLGINKLKEYWKKFFLDEPTGIDLSGEVSGILPDPQEKEKRTGQIWRIGDTYNVSIGQGDLSITPIRLLNFIASIANNGKTLRPFLVQKILDEKGNLIKENKPEEVFDYSDWFDEIKEVQKGMRDVVAQPYGTANRLYDLSYKTSAKTGSAQIQNNTKTNAFFVGYGPSDNPQIAILVLVEDAKEGSVNTLPIAYDVMKWYYTNRL